MHALLLYLAYVHIYTNIYVYDFSNLYTTDSVSLATYSLFNLQLMSLSSKIMNSHCKAITSFQNLDIDMHMVFAPAGIINVSPA